MTYSAVTTRSTAETGPPVRRLTLVPAGRSDASVRRFRLARLRLEDREVTRAARFAHLKHSHD
jgi:hypothetical protein